MWLAGTYSLVTLLVIAVHVEQCYIVMYLSVLRYRQNSLAIMEAYDPRRNVWLKLADMGDPCSGLGACTVFGLLYTVGWQTMLQNRLQTWCI